MFSTAIRDVRDRPFRKIGAAVALGSLIIWSGVANAATPPESFSPLAKKVTPAVVNIASIHELTQSESQAPNIPFHFPKGSPFEKFFRQFHGQNGGNGGQMHERVGALGSGFIVDPSGYVVTNDHVIKDGTDIKVRLEDGSVFPAKVIGADQETDLALLKINAGRPLPYVQFGNSNKSEVGDWVLAVGNPFGLGGTVTAGIISARGRNIQAGPYDDFLQIDAPINRGNSGGPLFDMNGQVIGINTAIYSPNGGSVGIGFAIPSNLAKPVIAQLKEHGKVDRGWLGVQIQPVTPAIASALNLKDRHGAIVAAVTPDSPASKAGVKAGDVILSFGGDRVENARDLARLVAKHPAGNKVQMEVWRDRAEMPLSVVTGHQPTQMAEAQTPSQSQSNSKNSSYRSEALKADLAALTPAVRSEFGIPDNVSGVLVFNVDGGSAFDQGLRDGDVIQRVGGTAVTTPQQVDQLMAKAKSADQKSVLFLVNRQGNDIFLGVKAVA
jgi:serine protease Do